MTNILSTVILTLGLVFVIQVFTKTKELKTAGYTRELTLYIDDLEVCAFNKEDYHRCRSLASFSLN